MQECGRDPRSQGRVERSQWWTEYQILNTRLAGGDVGKSRHAGTRWRRGVRLPESRSSSSTSNSGHPTSRTTASSTTTTTMSFARALVAASPFARLAAGRVSASRSLALAYRWHSTTPRLQQTEPHKPKDYLEPAPPMRSPGTRTATFTAADESGKDYDPYKDGPSAIDKAVHLFFFTEIIRGACGVHALSRQRLLKGMA